MLNRMLPVAIAMLAVLPVSAQTPAGGWKPKPGQEVDTIFMETKLGSFRLINGVGRAEFTFTGTVLISGLKGKVTPTGKVREEYKKGSRQAFFGTGKIVVEGEWRAVQWFGRNMKGQWNGAGIARMYGEFDSNLETGYYWFASNTEKEYWSPHGTERRFPIPRQAPNAPPKARPKPSSP